MTNSEMIGHSGDQAPPAGTASSIVSGDDCLLFAHRALDGMSRIVTDLGDYMANRRPDLPGANSPYQILSHCLGVCEYWGGRYIAGRVIHRDRDAEFIAAGEVVPLVERAQAARRQLVADVSVLRPHARGPEPPPASWNPTEDEREFTQGEALVHIVEELCQHHGQMELTRDLLLSGG